MPQIGTTSLYENKGIIRDNLMEQLKAYRNVSIKTALIFWISTFTGYFVINVMKIPETQLMIDDLLFESVKFSVVFALIGYCLGSAVGANLQRTRLARIQEERSKRKAYIEEQVSIRQAKLDTL